MVNRVHPETGIAHPLKKDHIILSKWAERYERDHGKTWCLDRVKNNADRHRASFNKARGQAATGFVKDRKSQERDGRPEYDRRAAGMRAKTTAMQAQRGETGLLPPAFAGTRLTASRSSPAALNRLQDRHNAERDALLQRYEQRKRDAEAKIETTYGAARRRDEARLAEIDAMRQHGWSLHRAKLGDERDRLERNLRVISMRSREILHPVAVEKQAALVILAEKQRQERQSTAPIGGDRRESGKTQEKDAGCAAPRSFNEPDREI